MSVIAAPITTPPTLYAAKQVRFVDPAQNGLIHMVDGSVLTFLITTGTPAITFVPSTNAGNVVPNPGDWILDQRSSLNTNTGNGPGSQSAAKQFQVPGSQQFFPAGPYLYFTNAQFQGAYNTNYAAGTPNQGIVP